MNIEIVNKQVADTLNLKEKDIELVNKFYWQRIKQHIYSYDPRPINIMNVCVLYPTAYLNKKQIKLFIKRIRYTLTSKRFKPESKVREAYLENYKKVLRKLLAIRKYNKFVN